MTEISAVNKVGNTAAVSANKVETKSAEPKNDEALIKTSNTKEVKLSDSDSSMAKEALDEAYDEANNEMLSPTVAKALKLASDEIGVSEDLDSKGVGHNTGEMEKYGGNKGDPWCASFVSWLFGKGQDKDNENTFGEEASVKQLKNDAKKAGFYKDKKDYTPKPGDVMIQLNKGASHTGIVTMVDDEYVYTIEGNAGDEVKPKKYAKDGDEYKKVSGYIQMNEWSGERPELKNTAYLSQASIDYVDADDFSKKTV